MRKLAVLIPILLLVLVVMPVGANPPGIPSKLKLAFNFNYIAAPAGTKENVNCGSGHRVFTYRETSGQIQWNYVLGGGIGIDDCLTKSIDDTDAVAHADQIDVYYVAVKVNGPNDPNNLLTICRKISALAVVPSDLTCVVGFVTLGKGHSFYTFPQKLFAQGNPEFWQLDPGTNFKVADFRLYVAA